MARLKETELELGEAKLKLSPLQNALKILTEVQTQLTTMKKETAAEATQATADIKAAQEATKQAAVAKTEAAKTVAQVATQYGLAVEDGRVTLKPNIDVARYSGSGTQASPFLKDGIPFTGFYGGKQYVNGVDSSIKITVTDTGTQFTKTDMPVVVSKPETGPTTNVSILKALLRNMGFTTGVIDASTSFLDRLLKDGLDYDNASTVFLYSKDYTFKDGTSITSPFYTEYGYLNEGLVTPKSAAELFNAVEGYKGIVDKYQLSNKYVSKEFLQKYVKNNVTVADLDERANTARLKAINADVSYTTALKSIGYIKNETELTDFFLNPDVGKQVLEQKRATAAFSAEAIRRAQQGITFDATRFSQIAAGLVEKGLSEAQISTLAATGFEQIGQELKPLQKFSEMYESLPPEDIASNAAAIQRQLESEQFLGITSNRKKALVGRESAAFQGQAGSMGASFRGQTAGII